jgi:hypothetical protein
MSELVMTQKQQTNYAGGKVTRCQPYWLECWTVPNDDLDTIELAVYRCGDCVDECLCLGECYRHCDHHGLFESATNVPGWVAK